MKLLIAIIIGLIPFNRLKIVLYNLLLDYEIAANCKIGFSLILCKKLNMSENASIGHLNLLFKINSIVMDQGASINNRNVFKHLRSMRLAENSLIRNANTFVRDPEVGQKGDFVIGSNSLITARHLFDLTDDIQIGNDTVIGGVGSQFWTHGFDIYRNGIQAPINIKNNCYVAAACQVNLGVVVESYNQIGLGTVVAKSITSQYGFWVSNDLVCKQQCIDISKEDGYVLDETCPQNHFYIKTFEKK